MGHHGFRVTSQAGQGSVCVRARVVQGGRLASEEVTAQPWGVLQTPASLNVEEVGPSLALSEPSDHLQAMWTREGDHPGQASCWGRLKPGHAAQGNGCYQIGA